MTDNAKKVIIDWLDANHAGFDELALQHWKNPEIAFEEIEAVKLQMEFMEKQGFKIIQKEGLPTAFMAEWGEGSPVIGLLGEYDALGGLSQDTVATKKPYKEGAPGHGCGHNVLGVGALMAACAAKEALKAAGLKGTIRYYGCPAEEQLTGKGKMAKLGYFDGTEVALAWHPHDITTVAACTMTAVYTARFQFTGRSAHAGAYPEMGRSALDAVELMNVGANYLREHMLDQDRLHYTITNGGQAPNIVPPEAEVWYFIRAPHEVELASLWQRLVKVAKGAAMMTETEVKVLPIGGCYNTLPSLSLNRILEDNLMNFAGVPGFDEKDMAFAREIRATLPENQITAAMKRPVPPEGDNSIMLSNPIPTHDQGTFMMGSSDVGDVANMMPTSMLWGATWPVGVLQHSWQASGCAGTALATKGMRQSAKAMAGAMFDLAKDKALLEETQAEFKKIRAGKVYKPIDDVLGVEGINELT